MGSAFNPRQPRLDHCCQAEQWTDKFWCTSSPPRATLFRKPLFPAPGARSRGLVSGRAIQLLPLPVSYQERQTSRKSLYSELSRPGENWVGMAAYSLRSNWSGSRWVTTHPHSIDQLIQQQRFRLWLYLPERFALGRETQGVAQATAHGQTGCVALLPMP